MAREARQVLRQRLADARSGRVIFVSHCLLNENARYLGGAFRPGCVDELVDACRREGLGICQMQCPEQRAWGGVLKPRVLAAYGARGTPLYPLRRLALALFLWRTRRAYRRLAEGVAREIEDYARSGFEVVGVVGVGGSPSCGVGTTLDLRRSLEVVARCPLAELDRRVVNEEAVLACRRPGAGMFVAALGRGLRRRHLAVSWYEHDLAAEIRGEPARLLPVAPPPPA